LSTSDDICKLLPVHGSAVCGSVLRYWANVPEEDYNHKLRLKYEIKYDLCS